MNNYEYKHFESDGKMIFYLQWQINNPKADVLIIHGMSDHISRYTEIALYLNTKGYSVYGLDLRGHGMTGLTNNNLSHYYGEDGFDAIDGDILKLINILSVGKKPFIIGHSMGSFISRGLINNNPDKFSGAILMGTGEYNISFENRILKFIGKTFDIDFDKISKRLYNISLKYLNKRFKEKSNFAWVSRDIEYIKEFEKDPLAGFVPNIKSLLSLSSKLKELSENEKIGEKIDLPVLFLSGTDDPIGDFGKGPFSLYNIYKNKFSDVDIKLYKDFRHEIINEIGKNIVFEHISDWLDNHCNN